MTMRFLDINLATDPVRNNAPYRWAYGVLAAVAFLFFVYNLFAYTRYGGALERLRAEHHQSAFLLNELQEKDRRHRKEMAGWDVDDLTRQATFAGNTIRRRTFSWTELFNQLEEVMPPQVKLAAIRPNISVEAIRIRVDGIAKGHPAILIFLENLQASPQFRDVYPGGERREDSGMMTFNLTFEYMPSEPAVEPVAVETAAGHAERGDADAAAADAGKSDAGQPEAADPVPADPPPMVAAVAPDEDQTAPGTDPPLPDDGKESGSAVADPIEPEPDPPVPATVATESVDAPVDPSATPLELPRHLRVGRRGNKGGRKPRTLPAPPPEAKELEWSGEILLQAETVSALYRRLARIGKVSIVLEEGLNLGQRVTARIEADTFDAALEQVAKIAGHILFRDGEGIYRIAPAGREPNRMVPPALEESDLESPASGEGGE